MADVKLSTIRTMALRSPTSLVGVYSSGNNFISVGFAPDVTFDAGDLTAGVWKSVVSLSAGGVIRLCGVRQNSTTSQQIGIRITIDGVVVLQFDNVAATGTGSGVIAIGFTPSINSTLAPEQVPFNSSFQLEVRSSIARAAGSSVQYLLQYYTI